MNAVHRAVITLTAGRFGWNLGGMPVLDLTTTGRRSGEPRTSLLTSPLRIGGHYVVVASRGGDDAHPAWFLNLSDNPEVTVATSGEPAEKLRARILEGIEREDVWDRIVERHPRYGEYQKKTSREIPLVVFEKQ